MILPIVVYNEPVLRKKCIEIDKKYPVLDELIADMFETMYNAKGIGLAAPQIGKSLRLFIVDLSQIIIPYVKCLTPLKQVFINAKIVRKYGKIFTLQEGCLSIPEVKEWIPRNYNIQIEYCDVNWNRHMETYGGLYARVVQHEYDHIEGKLFIDYLSQNALVGIDFFYQ
jgi:peptide deformylase